MSKKMFKKAKICSAVLSLFSLLSCGAVNAIHFNANVNSNIIKSTRGVLCEQCHHAYPKGFYVINGKICGHICKNKKKNKKKNTGTNTHGALKLTRRTGRHYGYSRVSAEAPLVESLKDFFNGFNWKLIRTNVYRIIPNINPLTIEFRGDYFTIRCEKLTKHFQIVDNNDDDITSASIIFKAFECFCQATGKHPYFHYETQNICDIPAVPATPAAPATPATPAAPAAPAAKKRPREDTVALLTPLPKRFKADYVAPTTDTIRKEFAHPATPAAKKRPKEDTAALLTPLSKRFKADYVAPTTDTIRKEFTHPATPVRPKINSVALRTPQKTPTFYTHKEHFLVTPESESKRTGKKYLTGISCNRQGIKDRLKEYILDKSNWTKNQTEIKNIPILLAQPLPQNTPQGYCINLEKAFGISPEFFNTKIPSSSNFEKPFFFHKNSNTLYCFQGGTLNEDLLSEAFEYLCKLLIKTDIPKLEIN